MFITSKKKYLSNDMIIFGTCSIPLSSRQNKYMNGGCGHDVHSTRTFVVVVNTEV